MKLTHDKIISRIQHYYETLVDKNIELEDLTLLSQDLNTQKLIEYKAQSELGKQLEQAFCELFREILYDHDE